MLWKFNCLFPDGDFFTTGYEFLIIFLALIGVFLILKGEKDFWLQTKSFEGEFSKHLSGE